MYQREGFFSETVRLISSSICTIILTMFAFASPMVAWPFVIGASPISLREIVTGMFLLGLLLTVIGIVSNQTKVSIQVLRGLAALLNLLPLTLSVVLVAQGYWPAFLATIVIFLGVLNLAALNAAFRADRFDPRKCEHCNYDLRGSKTMHCPECGTWRGA